MTRQTEHMVAHSRAFSSHDTQGVKSNPLNPPYQGEH